MSESWMNVIAKFGLEYEPNKLTPKVMDLIDLQTYVCDHMCSLMAWTKLSLKKYLRNWVSGYNVMALKWIQLFELQIYFERENIQIKFLVMTEFLKKKRKEN